MTIPSNSEVENVLPVQAYFNIDGSFNTFIGQGHPFVISATESIGVIDTLVNGTFYPTFSPVSSGQITSIDVTSTKLTWNPSTGVFSAPTFTGALNGTASNTANITGGTASNLVYQITAGQTGFIANGTSGQFLRSNGSSAPSWTSIATSVTIADETTSSSTFYPLFYSATSGSTNTVDTSSTKLQYIPSSGTLISTVFSGSGASLTNIPNSALTNSSFTLGSTSISLGNTVTTIAGLSSVTSTTFVGALTGNASTATTATNATNSAITDNTSSIATWYPTIVSNSTGNLPITTSSSKLSFVPNTGVLSATSFTGAGTGLTGTASSLSIGGTATTATNLAGGLAGYLPYQTAINTTTFLAPGTNGYVLTLSGGLPTWAASSGGVTTFSAGTTGLTPSSATSGAITLAGTLAIANGGTNATATPTAGAVPYGTGTAYAFTAAGTAGQALLSNGSSAPTWGTPSAGAGGSTTQVQYNSSGVLAGSANMTFNGTALTLANDATISTLTVGKGGGSVASNTAVGYQAINNAATGGSNTALGYGTLISLTSGSSNVAVGGNSFRGALYANTTGANNTAIGSSAAYSNTSGQGNTVVGTGAYALATTGIFNTGIGYQTMFNGIVTGGYNVTSGVYSANNLTTGSNNTISGYNAMSLITTANNSVAIGSNALQYNTTASNLVAVGYASLLNNTTNVASIGAITGGSSYTNGTYTAVATTPSSGATFSTYPTVTVTVSGGTVTAVTLVTAGVGASVSTATSLTVAAALIGGTGTAFSFVVNLQSGTQNTAVGYQSLNTNSTGGNNTALGYQSGLAVTTGSNNVFLGQSAGYTTTLTTTGFQLVYIGSGSRGSAATNQNEIAIGYNAVGLGSNTTVIGNTSTTLTQTYGVTKSTNYTVATLPSASTSGVGARAFVTDALAPSFGVTVVTGGAIATPVYSDGTNWKVG